MKRIVAMLLAGLPVFGCLGAVGAAEQLVPAGSVMQCTVSEPHISSKTMRVGDPVLCQLNRTEMYGRTVFPYGSYLEGRFEEYKDPGHFVGKGWMELRFDRMIVGNDTVLPITSRVVATSGKNPVDEEGRILGTGHAVRDTVEWMIPVLWPVDLINLPRRGPRPELKPETRLTVKLLGDIGIPTKNEVQHQPELISRFNYADNQAATGQYPQGYVPTPQAYAPQQQSPTVVVVQAQAPAPVVVQQAAAPIVVQQPAAPVVYGYPPPPYGYVYPPVVYRGYYRGY